MGLSGAVCPANRSKNILKDLQYIKETYVEYFLGGNESGLREASDLFSKIEKYIVEISEERKVLDAKLAEEIKKS